MRPEINLPPAPRFLTRFYGNLGYGRDVFRSQTITFIHASMMNDPFDPYFEFVNDFGDSYKTLQEWVGEAHGSSELQRFKKRMPYEVWTRCVRDVREKSLYFKKTTFLFCASAPQGTKEPSDNLYMWGHYGQGHSGIAIEFDANVVANSVLRIQLSLHPKWPKENKIWIPVFYRDTVEKLTPEDFYQFMRASDDRVMATKLAAHFNTISRTKSTVWQPEQEWRLMWQNDTTQEKIHRVPLLPKAVRRVFVGMRIADEAAKQIAAECLAAFPDARVLKGTPRPGEFALNFRLIS